MKSFLTAGFALATCAAFAALPEQTFDLMATGKIGTEGNWYGGTVEEVTGGKVLAIDGTVSCTNDTEAASSEFVKTSFKVFAPADATATADLPSEGLSDCQIAIATGPEATDPTNPEATDPTKLKVMVYGGATPAWTDTGLTVATGAWFTVTLHFDYKAKTAKVEIGGAYSDPVALVTKPESNVNVSKINSLSFVGSSKIDNVSIQEAVEQGSLPNELKGFTVYTTDLNVTTEELSSSATYAGGLTVAQQIQAGITPKSTTTSFVAKGLSTVTENNVVNTVITVPCNNDNGQVYQVAITDNAGTAISGSPVSATAGVIKENNTRDLTFTVPTTNVKVLKFNVVAKAPGSSN